MPCDTIQISTIDLDQVADVDLMADALVALGWVVNRHSGGLNAYGVGASIQVAANGHAQLSSENAASLPELKSAIAQEYSHQVVQQTARTYGWDVEETPERKYVLTRRY